MIRLSPVFQRFQKRLDELEQIFTHWVISAPPKLNNTDLMFLEGLVSTLWQHWSLFCRRLVFASATGCTTRSGNVVIGCVTPVTWERVSYIAWRANSKGAVRENLVNSDLKKEPTWGDVSKVQDVINVLSPNNHEHLSSCFGSISRGPVHIQIIRNATAHRNYQSLNRVNSLKVYYNIKPIRHPVEAVIWHDPTSRDYAFIAWIDEIRIISDLLTQ